MKNGSAIFISLLLFLTGVISAYSYNPASIGEFFYNIGGENLFLGCVLVISFAAIFFWFGRTSFGENTTVCAIISGGFALLITYGFYSQGINFDVTNIFYSMGFSDFAVDITIFLVVAVTIIFLLFKFRSNSLLVVGLFIIALSFVIGMSSEVIFLGGALIVIWLIFRAFSFWAERKVFGMSGPTNKFKFKNKFYNK